MKWFFSRSRQRHDPADRTSVSAEPRGTSEKRPAGGEGRCLACHTLAAVPTTVPPFGTPLICKRCHTPLGGVTTRHLKSQEVMALFGYRNRSLLHLTCPRCGVINYSVVSPRRGPEVAFYVNTEARNPRAFRQEVICIHCDKKFSVEWDRDPT
jgi:hypothetical protein